MPCTAHATCSMGWTPIPRPVHAVTGDPMMSSPTSLQSESPAASVQSVLLMTDGPQSHCRSLRPQSGNSPDRLLRRRRRPLLRHPVHLRCPARRASWWVLRGARAAAPVQSRASPVLGSGYLFSGSAQLHVPRHTRYGATGPWGHGATGLLDDEATGPTHPGSRKPMKESCLPRAGPCLLPDSCVAARLFGERMRPTSMHDGRTKSEHKKVQIRLSSRDKIREDWFDDMV
ncbi:hypothetical protein B0T18DRAFT_418920 [Schizothecium vesticola]|uniref:Uncharacterized protein n=1 Tax=Schizothecium vesticola TaxID=314040 RepID=A0AA40EKD6_9PEZI|nr:hypothetical protein B0T18DRAFT_418920 [Schizothecium vesticola]